MVEFSAGETEFLKKRDVARVATVSGGGWPQVTPVVHLFDGKYLYFIIDYGSKKERNMRENGKVAAVIDVYARTPQAVVIQGNAEFIEKGPEFERIEKMFEERHEYYKANPVKEGESQIIKVIPVTKKSWGL